MDEGRAALDLPAVGQALAHESKEGLRDVPVIHPWNPVRDERGVDANRQTGLQVSNRDLAKVEELSKFFNKLEMEGGRRGLAICRRGQNVFEELME